MNTRFITASLVAIALGGLSTACATKGFVKQQVGDVNSKVDTLSQSVEATQEQTKANAGKISQVDQQTQAAQAAATAAGRAADAADAKAGAAGALAGDLDKAARRLVYTVVISEAQGNFKLGAANLPAEAKAKIDELVAKLQTNPQAVYFEIEGHTDSTGTKELNDKLGLDRAEGVKRYLYEKYQIPLHKVNVISYGSDKPFASNDTREGRAQNRRVVIKVLQ
jgi:peptidoglycan-associated lipoprotein